MYETFREIVTERFKEYLPKQYKKMEVAVEPIKKVNCILDGLSLFDETNGFSVSPTIYINDMYDDYKETGSLEITLRIAAQRMITGMESASKRVAPIDFSNVQEKIVFQLVNTEQNREMLKDSPHRQFLDLSIIYRWVNKVDENELQSLIIRNEFADYLGFTEERLFQLAMENTKRIFPVCIKTITEVLSEMMGLWEMPMEDDEKMWVISNTQGINGAAVLLYEDGIHELAERLDSDLFILPSSIHEVIAIPSRFASPNELAKMVLDVNVNQVALGERLSNQVYHYSKERKTLTLATDTPYKSLDGRSSIIFR